MTAFGILAELVKVRITVFVTLSVATGYLLFLGRVDAGIVLPMLGVFVLSCGSAALNQVQEAKLDALMHRTKGRPIPSGRIGRDWALFVAMGFIGGGLYLLASIDRHTLWVLGLGVLAVVWYNGVYTPLKRTSAFAVVPGSLIGAIPPVIGWAAAGGVPTDPTILEIAFFFFLWQIPHFWLLILMIGPDYEAAGLPTPVRHFRPDQLRRITFTWMIAVAATGLALGLSLGYRVPWSLMVLVASIWLGFSSVPLLRAKASRMLFLGAFLRINLYAGVMMLILSLHAIVAA